MLVESRFPTKSFAALGTDKWLLPGVDPDVLLQGGGMNGSISTIFTLICLLTNVCHHVRLQARLMTC